jgi:hypothetical protein
MSSGGIAPTRFWSWIQRIVSIGALRGIVFSNRIGLYGSNQNSSADQLGLNLVELTKWEEHFMRGYFGSYLNADFLLEGNTLVRAMLLWTRLSDQENSYRVLGELGALDVLF